MFRKSTGIAVCLGLTCGAFTATDARSDVLVESDGLGVFPFDISVDGDATGGNVFVGRSVNSIPVDGTLTINADGTLNSVFTDRSYFIGARPGTVGVVNIIGNGTPESATVAGEQVFYLGGRDFTSNGSSTGGVGILNITDGGALLMEVDPANVFGTAGLVAAGFTDNSGGGEEFEAVISVDGVGSKIDVDFFGLGNTATGATGNLIVANGGQVNSQKTLDLGGGQLVEIGTFNVSEGSRVLVSGQGSEITSTGFVLGVDAASYAQTPVATNDAAQFTVERGGSVVAGTTNAGAMIGSGASAEMRITGPGSSFQVVSTPIDNQPGEDLGNEGDLLVGTTSPDFDFPSLSVEFLEGAGKLSIENQATVTVERDVYIGGNDSNILDFAEDVYGQVGPNSAGEVSVSSGGTINAGTIFVDDGGLLSGDGGSILADVILRGGTLAPGASPGTMLIDGDLELLDGLLQIEIAGNSPGMFDQLNVTGDLIAGAGFNIEIYFLDAFEPQEGDVFNFLNVDGDSSIFDTPSLINFSVFGGGMFGSNADLSFSGGGLSLVGGGIDMAPVPVPAGFPMLVTGMLCLTWLGKRHKKVSCSSR